MSSEDVEKIVAAILAVGCASKSRGAVDPWHFVQLYAGTLAELKKLPNTGAAENLEKDSRNNQREGSRAPRSKRRKALHHRKVVAVHDALSAIGPMRSRIPSQALHLRFGPRRGMIGGMNAGCVPEKSFVKRIPPKIMTVMQKAVMNVLRALEGRGNGLRPVLSWSCRLSSSRNEPLPTLVKAILSLNVTTDLQNSGMFGTVDAAIKIHA